MARLRLNVQEANGELPMICMRCGEPATVTRTRRMSWYPRWVWLLALGGLLPVLIVVLILTKRATLQAPFCDEHKGHWSRRRLIGFGSFALMVLFIIGEVVLVSNVPRQAQDALAGFAFLAGAVAVLAWLVVLVVLSSTAIRPAEITETDLWLDGVAPACIDALEETERQRRLKLRDLRRRRDEEDEYIPRPVRPADAIQQDTPRRNDPAATRFRNDFRGASAAPPPLPPFSRDAIAERGRRSALRFASRLNAIAPFVLPQHGQPIGAERFARTALPGFRERHELAAHDLLGLQRERSVVHEAIDAGVRHGRRALVAEGEQLLQRRVDAQLLAHLTAGAVGKRLTGRQHAAHRDIPMAREDVLRRRAQVDEQPAGVVEDEHIGAAMRQASAAYLPARHHADGAARVIDHVDQLVGGAHLRLPLTPPPLPSARGGGGEGR